MYLLVSTGLTKIFLANKFSCLRQSLLLAVGPPLSVSSEVLQWGLLRRGLWILSLPPGPSPPEAEECSEHLWGPPETNICFCSSIYLLALRQILVRTS